MITLNHFILALAIVESSLNPLAIGDDGNAVGYLQITPAVIKDVNYFYDRDYVLDDRFDKKKSVNICALYLKHWGEHYEKQTGSKPTAEIYAKIWNGGALAWRKTDPRVVNNLDNYWEKVQFLLGNIKNYELLK
jgi:soluble lytic murein transglycosylase-like protein